MQKKLLAAAVLAALSGTAAAQSTAVTISAVLAAEFAGVEAKGSTQNAVANAANTDVVSRSRLQDGNGSWLRFSATEDLGNGLAAWVQLESAVFGGFDTRAANIGGAATALNPQGAVGFATRNSGVGLRSNTWGSFVMGVWDVHYHTEGGVDSFGATAGGVSSAGAKSLFTNAGVGTASNGGRLSNVLRYESPNFNGFSVNVSYARPQDGVARIGGAGVAAGGGNIIEGKKNTVWAFNPSYTNGPITAFYSYYKETDLTDAVAAGNYGTTVLGGAAAAVAGATNANTAFAMSGGVLTTAAGGAAAAGGTSNVQSIIGTRGDRLGAAWTFPFGLKVGFVWDRLKYTADHQLTAAPVGALAVAGLGAAGSTFTSTLKRTAWALPITYTTGNHGIGFTYGKASKVDGSVSAATAGFNGSEMGAKYIMLGYQYAFSKRTNLFASYSKITNDALGSYDFFANGVGIAQTSRGADPISYGIGLRHTF